MVYYKRVHMMGRILVGGNLAVYARHVLEPLHQAKDYTALEAHPYWTSGNIGTGPYRVLDFRPQEVLELEVFNDYFLGRAKIDRVTVRLVGVET